MTGQRTTYLLNITKNHGRSLEETWIWLENNLEKQINKRVPFENISYSIFKERGVVDFQGRTVYGTMSISEGLIKISINLPLLYRFFSPHIKSAILSVLKEL